MFSLVTKKSLKLQYPHHLVVLAIPLSPPFHGSCHSTVLAIPRFMPFYCPRHSTVHAIPLSSPFYVPSLLTPDFCRIICGLQWVSLAVLGSFAVCSGCHLRSWDHLRSAVGITCGPGIICGPIWGSFAALYSPLRKILRRYR